MPEPSSRKSPLDVLAGNSFCRVASAHQFEGNSVRLLRDGGENYPAWLAAIGGANQSVHLENYLLREDQIGRAFADALIEAARRGVTCRVIYDWLGCARKTSREFWQRMREGGIEVRCYNPPHFGDPLMSVSRDHRKLLCIDQDLAFTGGLCIGDDWVGYPQKNIPAWRDTALEIRGPAALHLGETFADSWRSTGGTPYDTPLLRPEDAAHWGDIKLWVVAGRPDSMGLYRLEQLVAEIVERSLWLADAYFVASTAYVRALTGAARSGVDVRLLVPSSSNLPLVGAASRSAYRPLIEGGVRVYEWNGPMMHAKTAVADGCWSRVGSSNSNFASWITNRELDITIHDLGFAAEMEAMYLRDLENASEVTLSNGRPRISRGAAPFKTSYRARKTATRGRLVAGVIGFGGAANAALAQRRTLGVSETRNIALAGAGLVLLALIAALQSWLIDIPLAFFAAWVGITLLIRAYRLFKKTNKRG